MRHTLLAVSLSAVAAVLVYRPTSEEPVRRDEFPLRFTVATDGEPLIVPVTINGNQYSFIVDTGCTCTIFDNSLRHLMGPAVDSVFVSTTHAQIGMQRYLSPAAYLGSLMLPYKQP